MRNHAWRWLPLLLLICSRPEAAAQDALDDELAARCLAAALPTPRAAALCHDVAVAVQILQPEAGLALVGGNPVLGTASPLGPKFRFIPRLNIGGRLNFAFVDQPNVISYPDSAGDPIEKESFVLVSPQLDVSIALFKGVNLTTTLGGFGAVELLGSFGAIIYPSGKGFVNNSTAFGLGARIGVLRESFTAPGVSVSLYRKWSDRIQRGTSGFSDAEYGMDLRAWSFRGAISKSFVAFALGFTLGYDNFSSDVDYSVSEIAGAFLEPSVIPVATENDLVKLDSSRWSAFVDVSYIVLFVNLVGELGWQESETLLLSNGDDIKSGQFFSALGVRLTL